MSCDFTRGIQNKYTNADGTHATGVGSTLLPWLYHIICIIFYKAIFAERKYIFVRRWIFAPRNARVWIGTRPNKQQQQQQRRQHRRNKNSYLYYNNIILLLLHGNPTAKLQQCIAKFVCGTTEGYDTTSCILTET